MGFNRKAEAVGSAPTWRDRLSAIRALYESIAQTGERPEHIDPYSLGIHHYFTPIENALWQDIRSTGLPMLPQYPVGKYFVDFGDPGKRIAIEADGKEYHDRNKDRARDWALCLEHGWTVFRVSGSECVRIRPAPWEFEYIDGEPSDRAKSAAHEYFLMTSEGVVFAIYHRFYREKSGPFDGLIEETLFRHSLVPPVRC